MPPFDGASSFVNIFRYASDPTDNLAVPSFNLYLSHETGAAGSSTYTNLSDASDYDAAWALCRTAVLQWFRMPSTGQVRISGALETIDDYYSGSIVNEWGESSIDVRQNRLLYCQVTAPVVGERIYGSIGLTGEYHDTDENTHSWSRSRNGAGYRYEFQDRVIPGVFAAGTWVLVNVGIEHASSFSSNDCSVTTRQTTRFIVRSIALSSTGS